MQTSIVYCRELGTILLLRGTRVRVRRGKHVALRLLGAGADEDDEEHLEREWHGEHVADGGRRATHGGDGGREGEVGEAGDEVRRGRGDARGVRGEGEAEVGDVREDGGADAPCNVPEGERGGDGEVARA